FGDVAKRRILFGTTMLSSGYRDTHFAKAQQVRTLIKNDFEAAFKHYDIIIGPTTSTEAFKIGEDNQDSLAMQMNDILTVPVNLAVLPAISVQCGYSVKGLPLVYKLLENILMKVQFIKQRMLMNKLQIIIRNVQI